MKEPSPPMLQVRDWDRLYENNRSRDMKRTSWFPAPNDLSADGYVELAAHERGAAHFGVWNAILMVASRAKPRRGLLVKEDGRPHTAESLARITRFPEAVIQEAIDRLLQIGPLEAVEDASPGISNLPPHPGAGSPQGPARKPQEGAVEGKGTEHHHQEGNGKGNGKEKKGTERADEERKTEFSSAGSEAGFSQRTADDEENPDERYASPEDELKAIFLARAGEPITVDVLDAIRVNLELNVVTMAEFVSALKSHRSGHWRNPAGFLRDLSKKFRSKNQHAADPVTAAEAAEKNYRCQSCGSRVRGEGARLVGGKAMPCECASADYIARQRARGIFSDEAPE